jgi:hypothetical protein
MVTFHFYVHRGNSAAHAAQVVHLEIPDVVYVMLARARHTADNHAAAGNVEAV